eukprot:6054028-Pyramimonas_sp.AAC.1
MSPDSVAPPAPTHSPTSFDARPASLAHLVLFAPLASLGHAPIPTHIPPAASSLILVCFRIILIRLRLLPWAH